MNLSKIKLKYLVSAAILSMFIGIVIGAARPQTLSAPPSDSDSTQSATDRTTGDSARLDHRPQPAVDTRRDSTPLFAPADTTPVATDTAPPRKKNFLDDIINGKNKDSLIYDVKDKKVYIYREGDVGFQNMNLQADYMRIDMDTKNIFAHGIADSVKGDSHPIFKEGEASYTMDTITYNIDTKRAKIKGVATKEGDGWLIGNEVKLMEDKTINIRNGKYTTCDQTDNPHFYIAMTKAKVIPNKRIVTGPAYLVMAGVPIYILGVPEGFFPITKGAKSGIIMPKYGEDAQKGFFVRDLGYYFKLSDHASITVMGGIYTLGSWDASLSSRYVKRYKYNGDLNFEFSSIKTGEKGQPDYINQNNYRVQWTHVQDPKANPGSTFNASVNFATSGYSKNSATNINDILQTQTNSTISYSKSWAGTPFSLSANMAISQNSQNATISMTLPNIVFNVSRVYPFKRKEIVGKQRWYEKISLNYSLKMSNSVTAKEDSFFSEETVKNMKNGIEHSLPISASYSLFNYINLTPNFSYNERWYFRRDERKWDPTTNSVVNLDPEYGFYRIYNYNASVSASTTIYGTYLAKKPTYKLQAVRHTIMPNIGFAYAPNFGDQKYGFYKAVQTDSTGRFQVYSPYSNNAFGVPGSGESMSLTFGLAMGLEMKVLSKRDTSGVAKLKIIDEIRISGSYNFLADSLRLSTLPISLRTTLFGNFGINISATLDPYDVAPDGRRINKFLISRGIPGRIINAGWAFGYTFRSREDKSKFAINDINSFPAEYANPFFDPYGTMDPVLRRQYMAKTYYDFSIPWNFGFNYTVNYNVNYVNNGTTGYKRNVTQTIGVNASITLTPKTGITFQGGYDIMNNKLTTSSVSITRDLHCWQMSFSWIPFGYHRSWSFSIGVKASSLRDLKYDKSQSMYENLY